MLFTKRFAGKYKHFNHWSMEILRKQWGLVAYANARNGGNSSRVI